MSTLFYLSANKRLRVCLLQNVPFLTLEQGSRNVIIHTDDFEILKSSKLTIDEYFSSKKNRDVQLDQNFRLIRVRLVNPKFHSRRIIIRPICAIEEDHLFKYGGVVLKKAEWDIFCNIFLQLDYILTNFSLMALQLQKIKDGSLAWHCDP